MCIVQSSATRTRKVRRYMYKRLDIFMPKEFTESLVAPSRYPSEAAQDAQSAPSPAAPSARKLGLVVYEAVQDNITQAKSINERTYGEGTQLRRAATYPEQSLAPSSDFTRLALRLVTSVQCREAFRYTFSFCQNTLRKVSQFRQFKA